MTACRPPNAFIACSTMRLHGRKRRDAVGVGDRLAAGRADLLRATVSAGPAEPSSPPAERAAQIVDHDLRAFLRRDQRAVAADAVAAAGDQDDLAVQNAHRSISLKNKSDFAADGLCEPVGLAQGGKQFRPEAGDDQRADPAEHRRARPAPGSARPRRSRTRRARWRRR